MPPLPSAAGRTFALVSALAGAIAFAAPASAQQPASVPAAPPAAASAQQPPSGPAAPPAAASARQPTSAPARSPVAASSDSLAPGETRERRITGAGSDHWSLRIAEGRFVEVLVEQRAIDLVVRVRAPDGGLVGEFDSPTGAEGREEARWIATVAGDWLVEIAGFQEPGGPEPPDSGAYAVTWSAHRPPTGGDRLVLRADSLYALTLAPQPGAEPGQNSPADLMARASELYDQALPPGHPRRAGALARAAALYGDAGRHGDAERVLKRGLELLERDSVAAHAAAATLLGQLGTLYEDLARYDEAAAAYERALVLSERLNGPEHVANAGSLYRLAGTHRYQGRFTEAETLLQRALRLREQAFGSESWRVVPTLNLLAIVATDAARAEEAERLFRRAVAVAEKDLGKEDPMLASVLASFGSFLTDEGRTAEAIEVLERVAAIDAATLGPDEPDLAVGLSNLASAYADAGRFDAARPLFERAMAIIEHAFGTEHVYHATMLSRLAKLHLDAGRTADALALLDRAIPGLDAAVGLPIPRINAYVRRARARRATGDKAGALKDLEEALRSLEDLRPQVGGGEEGRAAFSAAFGDHYDLMVDWQLDAGDVASAFDFAERGRARVLLDQLAAGKVDIRAGIPERLRRELEARERRARTAIAEYQQRITLARSRTDLPALERSRAVLALQDLLREADARFRQVYREVKNASPLWRDLITTGGQPVTLRDVHRHVVPAGGLLLLYQVGDSASQLFVLGPNPRDIAAHPLVVSAADAAILGLPAGLLSAGSLARALAGHDPASAPKAGGGAPGAQAIGAGAGAKPAGAESGLLWQLGTRGIGVVRKATTLTALHALWRVLVPEPVRARLAAAGEVVLVPDGALFGLPFEALVLEEGADAASSKFWLDAGPPIRYAPSATVLYNLQRRPAPAAAPAGDAPVLLTLADPIYDPAEVARLRGGTPARPEAGAARPARQAGGAREALRSGRGLDDVVRAGDALERLPGTAAEAGAVAQSFSAAHGPARVVRLTGLDATEARFRQLAASTRYLHLATHGLVDQRRGALFAALAMTPPAGQTADADDDGYLQLWEVHDLPLDETRLAVLSACETNVGEFVEGEGVFALSRGFLAAGAASVIASQWPVDDVSTAKLMGVLFDRIAQAERRGERPDLARALWDAKREVRREKASEAPFHWAPFVLIGRN